MSEQIEGYNPVMEALKAGRPLNKLLVAREFRNYKELAWLAKNQGVPVQVVDRRHLDQIAHSHSHQGVIAMAAPKAYVDVEDIITVPEPFLVLLDGIEDPQNLGAILRTADACGVHGIVIPKRRSTPLTAAVGKASAGAIEYVPVARVSNLVQTMVMLKQKGCWIVGADGAADKSCFEVDLKGPLALVVGSEGRGLSRLVKERCDFLVKLPMAGKINSLNAATAASVIMYEIFRQRLSNG